MPNYNESSIAGTKWTRSMGGSFNNLYQGTPSIRFEEEDVVALADGALIQQARLPGANPVTTTLTDPQKTFPLLNPTDGTTVGEAKYQDVFVLLHSLYMALATERDQAAQVSQPEPVTPPTEPVGDTAPVTP